MDKHSRRDFMKTSALGAVSLALSAPGLTAVERPHLVFPTEPRQRLGASSYSFRAYIDSPSGYERDPKLPGIDLRDFGRAVRDRLNLVHIEPWNAHFRSTEPGYLAQLRSAWNRAGVTPINIAADVEFSIYDPDGARRAKAVSLGKTWVDAAAAVGSPGIRLNNPGVRGMKPSLELAVDSLRQVADQGAEKNVHLSLENDNPVSEDPFFLVSVIEKANHPWLHALPDFGNSLTERGPEFNDRAMKAMFKHAYCISHMKDGEYKDNGEFVKVDVAKTFVIAKAAGYRGYFSIEWEGHGDPFDATGRLIDECLKNLA
ncbi:MAG TPA: TIM barrel protein [Terriglobia bacterium]|nr:TIM barrel protein [Terriglobia bacterium]